MKTNEWRNNKKDFIKFIEFAEKLANKHNPDSWEKKLDAFDDLLEALEIFTKQKFESSEEIDCYIFHKSHIEKAETAIKKAQ